MIKVTSRVFGKIFSVVAEPSALNNCIPPIFNKGSIVIAITITPMPPSHCNIALHIRILLGVVSRLVMIVEPVVVIPDMLSKNASTNDNPRLEWKECRVMLYTSQISAPQRTPTAIIGRFVRNVVGS